MNITEIIILGFFILFGVCVLTIVFYQHKLFDYLRNFHNDFLNNLTDGKDRIGKRGDPSKGLFFFFSDELSSDDKVKLYKKIIKLILCILVTSFILLFIYMLYLGGKPLPY